MAKLEIEFDFPNQERSACAAPNQHHKRVTMRLFIAALAAFGLANASADSGDHRLLVGTNNKAISLAEIWTTGALHTLAIRNTSNEPIKAFRAKLLKLNDFDEGKELLTVEFSSQSLYLTTEPNVLESPHVIKPGERIFFNKGLGQDGLSDLPLLLGLFSAEPVVSEATPEDGKSNKRDGKEKGSLAEGRFLLKITEIVKAEPNDLAIQPERSRLKPKPPPLNRWEDMTRPVELTGETTPIAYELKSANPTPRERLAMYAHGYAYRDSDEFTRHDLQVKLNKLLDQRIAEAKPGDRYSVTEEVTLGEYDFAKNAFPTRDKNARPRLEVPHQASGSSQVSSTYYYVRPTHPETLGFVPVDPQVARGFAEALKISRQAELTYIGTLDKSVEEQKIDAGRSTFSSEKVLYLNVSEIKITLKQSGQNVAYKLPETVQPTTPRTASGTMLPPPRAISADEDSGKPPVPQSRETPPTKTKLRLTASDISGHDLSRLQLEIDTIYARYGAEFPKKSTQAWAEQQPWYHRVPGRTPDAAEDLFSEADRSNIEILAARRDALRSVGGAGSVPEAGADRILQAATANFVAAGNSRSLEDEMVLYAESVDYYGEGAKNQEQIRADQTKYREKWPKRRYQVLRIIESQYDRSKDVGTVIVQIAFDASNNSQRRTGAVETKLVFSSVSSKPKIIAVAELKRK